MKSIVPFDWALWAVAAFGWSWLAVLAIQRGAERLGLLDRPNGRSLHRHPTARGGGLGFVVVFAVVWIAASGHLGIELAPSAWRLLGAALLVAAVSLFDDFFGLPARVRICVHAAAAAFVVHGYPSAPVTPIPLLGQLDVGPLMPLIAIFWIVAVTNFFNFMDGIDGLAAGQATLTFVAGFWIAWRADDPATALCLLLLAAAVLGFLLHNWPPATIFMGDVGSTFLGFSLGALAVAPAGAGIAASIPFPIWGLLLAPFLLDATVTLGRRMVRREQWYQAHRQHFYQRLVDKGWSHLAVTSTYLAVTAALASVAILQFG